MHPLHPRLTPFELRRGVLFLGNFQHAPNVDSARYLVREVMPTVWAQLPGLPVWLVGGFPPASIKALANANVFVTGHMADLTPIMAQVRVAPAPLRYGAGIKNKVIDSMAYGVPVVTTRLGAEGLPVAQGFNILVADTAAELGSAIVALHEDPFLWERISRAGRDTVATFYSADVLRAQLATTLQRYLVGQ
ncbi:MAG: glycosyltransferase [Anaerolineales bacterium]|nr:glycosyltransferase [Anaerolineales bacterium]